MLYLHAHQRIPVQRLVETFRDRFGRKRSEGTVVTMISRGARDYRGCVDRVRDAVVPVWGKPMDETELRIEGTLPWLHVACTGRLPSLWIGPGRGDVLLAAGGMVVHECWKSYFALPKGAGHGMCPAPILRERERRVPFGRATWAGTRAGLLCGAVQECNLARGSPLVADILAAIADNDDRMVEEGFRYHESLQPLPSNGRRGRKKQRKGYNLLLRLREHRDAVLLFPRNPLVPATNTMAALAIRMEKV